MIEIKGKLRWAMIISVFAIILVLSGWLILRSTAPDVSPVKGNPSVPARPPEAVRLEKAFNKLLQEKNSTKTGATPSTRNNKKQ